MKSRTVIVVMALVATVLVANVVQANPGGNPNDEKGHGQDAIEPMSREWRDVFSEEYASAPCRRGMAGDFPCHNVNLDAFLPNDAIGGGRGSDVWGWTDPETGRRYVIAGRETGTSFIDVTNSRRPVYLGNLPQAGTTTVIWRDIKVYADHAYIVGEAREQGMQVFDLRQLRGMTRARGPVTFSETAHYTEFGRTHNIGINEETGFAYAVGNREDQRACRGGLHMIDLSEPADPTFAGCVDEDGYVHDTHCTVYDGPDAAYTGREICFNSNEDTLTIVDVTDKDNPIQISRTGYDGQAYTHQGWLTDDGYHFLMGDEGDENRLGVNTRTFIWDVEDLDEIPEPAAHEGPTRSIDHNLYIKGDLVYQSNYREGFRIRGLENVAQGELVDKAWFDVWPPDDNTAFSAGTWSNYPFFDNGLVAVHGYQGLFLLRPVGVGVR